MHLVLLILQAMTALLYGASGVMKVFLFERVSHDVPSFGALSRRVWTVLGVVELACVPGLLVPTALVWQPWLAAVAAGVLAAESGLFVWVHVKYREVGATVFSAALGLVMAFIAYGRSGYGSG